MSRIIVRRLDDGVECLVKRRRPTYRWVMEAPLTILLVMAALGLIVILPILLVVRTGRHMYGGNDPGRTAEPPASALGSLGPTEWQPDVFPRRARGEPIEQLSADLRRLRGRICARDRHASASHEAALCRAYDQALIDACELLDVEHELDQQTAGIDRDLERLRVEAELERRGIVLSRPPSGHAT